MKKLNIGIVGASGAVGLEILKLLKDRNFPIETLKCFASSRSEGNLLPFGESKIIIEKLSANFSSSLDLVFFSAGSSVSRKYIPLALEAGAIVIDNSSAFRLEENVPLVIPEVNPEALLRHNSLIANPNCATILLLMALAPLHRQAKLKRVVVSTYQAASGAGLKGMEDLKLETLALLQGSSYQRVVIPHPYAFNLFLHNSPLLENGYVGEEMKIIQESRKILNDPSLQIAATCVRVPVLRSHAESINAEFHHPISAEKARLILQNTPGITLLEDYAQNRFPMPIDASGNDSIFCGRIREDLSQKNTLDLWVVGDQLLKGAALNAIQIAETLHKKY
ncbi:MAG: aspartate-semialdehyde dehydrogenase [Verrucomicrobia bacterium]|nr:aspartate-semialdehyde dehydrogenase [Verrucomicrobiota bacterium]